MATVVHSMIKDSLLLVLIIVVHLLSRSYSETINCNNADCSCNGGEDCTINCAGNSCDNQQLTCAVGYNCNIHCNGGYSCQLANINAVNAHNVYVLCDNQYGCNGLTLNCPYGYVCNIDCTNDYGCTNLKLNGADASEVNVYCADNGDPFQLCRNANIVCGFKCNINCASPNANSAETCTGIIIDDTNAKIFDLTCDGTCNAYSFRNTNPPTYNPSKQPTTPPTQSPTYIPTYIPTMYPTYISTTSNPTLNVLPSSPTVNRGSSEVDTTKYNVSDKHESEENKSESTDNSIIIILICVIGGLFYIVLMLFMYCKYMKRKKNDNNSDTRIIMNKNVKSVSTISSDANDIAMATMNGGIQNKQETDDEEAEELFKTNINVDDTTHGDTNGNTQKKIKEINRNTGNNVTSRGFV